MNKPGLDFLALCKIEEDLLRSKLDAARKAISHAGEKGRSLEAEVTTLLRSFLPGEYGLTTGFVVYHTAKGLHLSSQLDIIIYDPIRSGPIARLATCDVLPLEAVYGYIEVKAVLKSSPDDTQRFADNSIEKCLERNKELRNMTDRRFWTPIVNDPVSAGLIRKEWVSIRSYIFAFEAEGTVAQNAEQFAQRIADYSARLGVPVHLHGIFVAGQGYYVTQAVDTRKAKPEDYFHVAWETMQPLAAFKWSLIQSLARFPRFPAGWTPAVDQYHKREFHLNEERWPSRAPRPANTKEGRKSKQKTQLLKS
jgi:hypothetical protein